MARESTPTQLRPEAVQKQTERTLVTGFGPFHGVPSNPSGLLAEESGRPHHIIEVSYRSVREFVSRLDPNSFDRLLLLGVATGSEKCRVELFARNLIGTTPDVFGEAPGPCEITKGAPRVLGGTLWDNTRLLHHDLLAEHELLMHSFSAGTYLCNFIYFEALMRFRDKRIGFVHVPTVEDMSLDLQRQAVQEVIERIEQPLTAKA